MGNAAEEALRKAGIEKSRYRSACSASGEYPDYSIGAEPPEPPEEKSMINLDKYGNMSAASIPVALAEAVEQGRVNEGDSCCSLALAAA